MRKAIIVIIWLVVMFGGLYILVTNPNPEAYGAEITFANECELWAYIEGEDNYPDSAIMHSIGCDNNGLVGGTYHRMEGECYLHARRGYRNGLDAASPELVQYVKSFGCEAFEDGSYRNVD